MLNNNEFVNINTIINRFSIELENLDTSIEQLDNLEIGINEGSLAVLLSKLDEVRQFNKYWRNYMSSYKYAVERDIISRDKKIKELEVEIMKIKEENRQLRLRLAEAKKERDDIIERMYNRFESADELLDRIKNNIGFFRNQEEVKEQAKEDRHGENAPAFKKEVRNEAIVADLESGLTIKEIAKKYGMTYQGVRYRIRKMEEKNNG